MSGQRGFGQKCISSLSRVSYRRDDLCRFQVPEPLFRSGDLTHIQPGFHCDDAKGCVYMVTDPDIAAVGKLSPPVQHSFPNSSCKNQNRRTFNGPVLLSEPPRDLHKLQTHFDPTYNGVDKSNRRLTKPSPPDRQVQAEGDLCWTMGTFQLSDVLLIPVLALDRLFPQLIGVNHSCSEQS